jgi:hypothetical protein
VVVKLFVGLEVKFSPQKILWFLSRPFLIWFCFEVQADNCLQFGDAALAYAEEKGLSINRVKEVYRQIVSNCQRYISAQNKIRN